MSAITFLIKMALVFSLTIASPFLYKVLMAMSTIENSFKHKKIIAIQNVIFNISI